MGFWDRQIVDLEIAGIRVSDLEVDALENGGEVALIIPLPSPDWIYGQVDDMNDGHGNRVYLPMLMDAEAPLGILEKGNLRHKARTYADELDGEWGGDLWREYPSYVGTMQWESAEKYTQCFTGWPEFVRAYRIWSGRPLLEHEKPAFKRLQDATFQRLNDSDYFFTEAVLMNEESGDVDLESAAVHYGFVKPPEHLDLRAWESRWEMGYTGWDNEWLKELAQEYAEHADRNHIFGWSWTDEKTEMTTLEFKPLEDYLAPGDVEAYDLWTSLIARREVSKRRVEAYWHPNTGYQFNWNERQLA